MQTLNNNNTIIQAPDDIPINNYENVIVSLTDQEFNNLDEVEFDSLDKEHTCNICLETIIDDDSRIIRLSCNHIFNYDCIENWLKNYSNKCPVCRTEVSCGQPNI